MKFNPNGSWVVLPDPTKTQTESGIFLDEDTANKNATNILEVLAVGPEAKWVKAGDTVMIDPSGKGHIISLDEVSYVMVPEFMVLGVM